MKAKRKEKMDSIIREVVELSEKLDRIFYFVCPENVQLTDVFQDLVGEDLADSYGFRLYAKRSGPSVQDPQSLFKELSAIGIEKFDIVYVGRKDDRIIVLSHNQKVEFFNKLNKCTDNSGLIARSLIDFEDNSSELVFEDDPE